MWHILQAEIDTKENVRGAISCPLAWKVSQRWKEHFLWLSHTYKQGRASSVLMIRMEIFSNCTVELTYFKVLIRIKYIWTVHFHCPSRCKGWGCTCCSSTSIGVLRPPQLCWGCWGVHFHFSRHWQSLCHLGVRDWLEPWVFTDPWVCAAGGLWGVSHESDACESGPGQQLQADRDICGGRSDQARLRDCAGKESISRSFRWSINQPINVKCQHQCQNQCLKSISIEIVLSAHKKARPARAHNVISSPFIRVAKQDEWMHRYQKETTSYKACLSWCVTATR